MPPLQCHALVEEHEETLENWYRHKQRSNPDVHKWLCIEQLKLCCPKGHFGPHCQPCPAGPGTEPDRPCFGRGRCDVSAL